MLFNKLYVNDGFLIRNINNKFFLLFFNIFCVYKLFVPVFISVSVLVSLSITFRKASDNYEYFLSSAKRLMDVAITPIAVVDPDGKIIHTNKAMIAMTGMSKESLSKTQLSSYFENCKNVDEIINADSFC